jgi:hypothetical protein
MIKSFIRQFITEKYGNGLDIQLRELLKNGWESPRENVLDGLGDTLERPNTVQSELLDLDGNGEDSDSKENSLGQLAVFN